MRIVIPGGSGQVGTVLARAFHAQGHDVVVLSRRAAIRPWRVVQWDGSSRTEGTLTRCPRTAPLGSEGAGAGRMLPFGAPGSSLQDGGHCPVVLLP
jgi:NAD(P)-dependent dehydrogenase (short-subunit alcohol dehydrogenase family)